MKTKSVLLALATVGALGGGAVHAGNVFWSVGVSQPGVQVGVSNAPPPRPVVVNQPVYYPAPVVVQTAPVVTYPVGYPVTYPVTYPVSYPVVQPYPVVQTGWVPPGYGHRGWREREWRAHEWREHERFEHRGWDRR